MAKPPTPTEIVVKKRDVAPRSVLRGPSNIVVAPMPVQSFSRWSVDTVKMALDDHERGYFMESATLVDSMGRDDRIKGCLGTRVKALVGKNGLPFNVKPSDDGNKARCKVIARQLAPLWQRVLPDSTLAALIRDATMLGVALARVVWTLLDGQWVPSLIPVPAHGLYYNYSGVDGQVGYYLQTLTGVIFIDPEDPHWFLYAPAGPRAWMDGAVRALGMMYVMRGFSYRDWVRYCEKHGMPIITISEPSDASPASKDAFYKRLQKLGSESVIRLPVNKDGNGFKIAMVEATDTAWQTFDHFIARIDIAVAVVLLGQNMTTDPQANAHGVQNARLVRQDYLDADVQPLMTELREQIIKPWGRYNIAGWDDDLAPWADWDTRPPEDLKARSDTLVSLSDAITKLVDAGLPVDATKLAEQYNVPLRPGADRNDFGSLTQQHYTFGIITVNEARARLGLEPFPDGDVPTKAPVAPPAIGGNPPPGHPLHNPNLPHTPPDPNADIVDESAGNAPIGTADPNAGKPNPFAPKDVTKGAEGGEQRSPAGVLDGQAYADDLATRARSQGVAALGVDVQALMALVESATSLQDMQGKLAAAYEGMSREALADVMERALIMGELAGRFAVLEDV